VRSLRDVFDIERDSFIEMMRVEMLKEGLRNPDLWRREQPQKDEIDTIVMVWLRLTSLTSEEMRCSRA
jgi:hypothetical protein